MNVTILSDVRLVAGIPANTPNRRIIRTCWRSCHAHAVNSAGLKCCHRVTVRVLIHSNGQRCRRNNSRRRNCGSGTRSKQNCGNESRTTNNTVVMEEIIVIQAGGIRHTSVFDPRIINPKEILSGQNSLRTSNTEFGLRNLNCARIEISVINVERGRQSVNINTRLEFRCGNQNQIFGISKRRHSSRIVHPGRKTHITGNRTHLTQSGLGVRFGRRQTRHVTNLNLKESAHLFVLRD